MHCHPNYWRMCCKSLAEQSASCRALDRTLLEKPCSAVLEVLSSTWLPYPQQLVHLLRRTVLRSWKRVAFRGSLNCKNGNVCTIVQLLSSRMMLHPAPKHWTYASQTCLHGEHQAERPGNVSKAALYQPRLLSATLCRHVLSQGC